MGGIAPENDDRLRRLMVRYQAGDASAFEELHRDLVPVLRGHLCNLSRDRARVDDLLQDAFLQIHRARHTYDAAFPVYPWVLTIARHAFLMDCRRRKRRGDAVVQPIDEERPLQACASHEQAIVARSTLGSALSSLSKSTRETVVLHHVHGFSFDEISKRLHIAGPALRARASRGVARLRDRLMSAGEGNGND